MILIKSFDIITLIIRCVAHFPGTIYLQMDRWRQQKILEKTDQDAIMKVISVNLSSYLQRNPDNSRQFIP